MITARDGDRTEYASPEALKCSVWKTIYASASMKSRAKFFFLDSWPRALMGISIAAYRV